MKKKMKLISNLKNVVRLLPMAALIIGTAACSDDNEEPLSEDRYSLTVIADAGGGVSSVQNEYTEGEEVTVAATPDDGYYFSAWYEGEQSVSENPVYTFPMPSRDVVLRATFSKNPDAGGANYLVVYYTWSGNSRTLANDIAGILNCNAIQVEVTTPYNATTDQQLYPIAQAEIAAIDNNETYPSISTTVENIGSYDAVVLVYPLWYSRMATPMQSFLHNYGSALAGKTIALVCTSASSGISGTVTDARRLCPNSTFPEALWIRSSAVSSSHASIVTWLENLGLSSGNS